MLEKKINKKIILLELVIGILCCAGIFLFFYLRNYQPSGEDVYGHLYKAKFLGDQIKGGVYYPLYARDWYNGYQPFRYWPILCYYVMAFFYLLTGNVIYTYYLLFVITFAIGYIGFCLIANREKRMIFIVIGIFYFFLPDNIRLMLGEGNLARVFFMGLLPLFFYFYTNLIEHKKSFIPTVLMVVLFTNVHVMLAAMSCIIFSIYGLFVGLKKRTWYLGPVAFVLGFLCAGIVLLPALIGDVVGGTGSSTSSDVANWSQSLLLSLSFTKRMQGETAGTFALMVVLLAIVILLFGQRKKGTIIALFFLAMTSTVFLPIVELLPFWMLRYVQMCYVLICYEWGFLEFKKKGLIWLTFVAVLIDILPSYKLVFNNEEPMVADSLLTEAVDHTSNRLGVLDESEFKLYISYYAYEQGVDYVQGWGMQGAKTRNRIVYMTEAMKYGYYSYSFREMLELGCDSVLIKKSILPQDSKIGEIADAAAQYGYSFIEETETSLLFDLTGVEGSFGVNVTSDNLAIGTSALYVSYLYPSFVAGDSNDLSDYSYDELKGYKKIYLSGFTYEDQDAFEELLQKLNAANVDVYIDAASVPQGMYQIGKLFGVEIQNIELKKVDSWQYGDETYQFQLPSEWRSVYLTSSAEDVSLETFQTDQLELGYYATRDHIHIIGMNLPYMLAEDAREQNQEELRMLMESIFQVDASDRQLAYEIVPLEISYDKEGMSISAEEDVCTNIAYQDNFQSDQEIEEQNHLVAVKAGTTRITYQYALFKEGMIMSCVGVAATFVVWLLLFRLAWDPLVWLKKIMQKILEQ